ncbi:MAG: type VI secretion system ATPase TssH [Maricaulaceae bacterium]
MAMLDLRALVSRLNGFTREGLEASAGLALSRTHYDIEIEHWLLKLADKADADVHLILRHFDVDVTRFGRDLHNALDKFKTGNGRAPALSPHLVKLSREGWLFASLACQAGAVRSGHLIAALVLDDDLNRIAKDISSQFNRITPDVLDRDLDAITEGSSEAEAAAPIAAANADSGAGAPASPMAAAGSGALDKYAIDVTARAKAGEIDPVLGRDAEIRQVVDILTRRRQNNPILTGEAGVGKTAAVEGFALKIAAGDVPDPLKHIRLLSLDLGLLQAGAGVKGEFENRLKSVIQEVKTSPQPIIMFIDEAHTLIGAGGAEGQGDAANLLKPALARGEMRTIAATTWAEYKKYFEKDPALTRRFQVVKIEEPSEAVAIQMMRGLAPVLEAHHGVRVLNEAVDAAVRLSHRYIPARQLPDKAISLLDTACARVGISQTATPGPVEDLRRRIELLGVEIGVLTREQTGGADHGEVIATLTAEKVGLEAAFAELEARWGEEKDKVADINAVRAQLEADAQGDAVGPLKADLSEKVDALKARQGDNPLVFDVVDKDAVAEVVANWTGIPVGRMATSDIENVLNLKDRMLERIKGQDHALEAIAEAMRVSQAKLTDPRKPIGVFLMCGTSGVGKTETAVTLAELVYGGQQNMTVINMSEFKEEHKVSMLLGSPPGYVGYGEGGVLTEAVRRRPYSVVLLDEMEKAHPGVQDVFYQVFDKGMLKDGQGRDIDFKNTMIIMTSNAGTETIEKLAADPETMPDADGLAAALKPELLKVFKPAFLGRVTVAPYFPLSPDVMKLIIGISLERLKTRVAESYGAGLTWSGAVVEAIAERCTDPQSGARNIENIIKRTLTPELAGLFLSRMASKEIFAQVALDVDTNGKFAYKIT